MSMFITWLVLTVVGTGTLGLPLLLALDARR